MTDYSEEGRRLRGIMHATGARTIYRSMDAVLTHSSGGQILVGNEDAARGPASTFADKRITHIVNCTDDMPNYCSHAEEQLKYLRFNVAYWQSAGDRRAEHPATAEEKIKFLQTLFDFVDDALSKGNNVLVHCLAGAHRSLC